MRRVLLLCAAVLGLAGCSHFHALARLVRPAPWVKATPVAVAAAPEAPDEGRNRIYRQAVAAIEQRDYGLALDLLQLARTAAPGDARVLNGLGVVYDKLQRFDLSARYYDLAEKADPGSRIVQANRRYSAVLQARAKDMQAGRDTGLARDPALVRSAHREGDRLER